MASQRFDQCAFSQGQLDPRVQARTDWENYYKAAKQITNGLVIPQGGVTCRWGTTYVDTCTVVANNLALYAEISVLTYDNQAIYLMLWEAASLKIYLEDLLVSTVSTQYAQEDIPTLRFTQVQTRIILNTGNYLQQQLVRSSDSAVSITAFTSSTLTANTGYAAGLVLPVVFATSTSLPTTQPQIFAGRNYFIRTFAANTFSVYSSADDARANINVYVISSAGTGATVAVQNTWTLSNIVFKFFPAYDFNGGYFGSTFTFTPSATSGVITLTASGAIFTAAMVGGLYTGNGGIVRLTVFTDSTHMNGFTIEPFPNTNAIQGNQSFLGEPAWSAARGYPRSGSFIQNRLWQGGTSQLPNGQWLSVVNDVYNFDDSQTLADDAISSYPADAGMSYIQSATAARSLLVHTNDANYSTPVQSEAVLTPSNYVLTIQNKFGVGSLQPVFIDNQIFFVDNSGNNIITMIWEFTQSSYVTNSASVKSSNLIVNPVDMSAFQEPNFIDGFFVLFVNADGTLAVLQTLHEENISAFTLSNTFTYPVTDQNSGATPVASSFTRVVSALNRTWFLVERTVPVAQTPVAITAFTGGATNSLTATAHGMTTGVPTLITFTTSGALPATTPQIDTTEYWFALPLDANTFQIYQDSTDALATTNMLTVTSFGSASNVVPWISTNKLAIETVDFNVKTDSSTTVTNASPATVITGLDHLNGQSVQILADGFWIPNQTVFAGQITLTTAASVVKVGLEFDTTLVPLPPALPLVPGMLYKPRHIRNLYINYYNSVGATVQSYGMPVQDMQQIVLNAPVVPQTGVFEYTLMNGWGGATPDDIIIQQSAPLPMTILALSYILEV
jgi:hypothetical protein